MGFFSWLTADTKKSISSIHSSRRPKTVYLINPKHHPTCPASPIREDAYEGYGVFGSTDVFMWLAKANIPADYLVDAKGLPLGDEDLRQAGVFIDGAEFYVDQKGNKWVCALHFPLPLVNRFKDLHTFGNYDEQLPSLDNLTPNLLNEKKLWTRVPGIKIFGVKQVHGSLPFPLKFSFNKDADYDSLPPSETCPAQGYFY